MTRTLMAKDRNHPVIDENSLAEELYQIGARFGDCEFPQSNDYQRRAPAIREANGIVPTPANDFGGVGPNHVHAEPHFTLAVPHQSNDAHVPQGVRERSP